MKKSNASASKPKFKIGDEVRDIDPHFGIGVIREMVSADNRHIYGVHYYRYTSQNPDDILDSHEDEIRLLSKLEKALK